MLYCCDSCCRATAMGDVTTATWHAPPASGIATSTKEALLSRSTPPHDRTKLLGSKPALEAMSAARLETVASVATSTHTSSLPAMVAVTSISSPRNRGLHRRLKVAGNTPRQVEPRQEKEMESEHETQQQRRGERGGGGTPPILGGQTILSLPHGSVQSCRQNRKIKIWVVSGAQT